MAKFTNEQIKRAEDNGVSFQLLHNRVSRGWDIETSIITPPNSRDEVSKVVREKQQKNRSDSWYSYGAGKVLKCPVPGCDHVGGVITKAHCRMHHGMERDEVKKKYGMPMKVEFRKVVHVDERKTRVR